MLLLVGEEGYTFVIGIVENGSIVGCCRRWEALKIRLFQLLAESVSQAPLIERNFPILRSKQFSSPVQKTSSRTV